MFRKYDKLISAASLANPKNNFLVRFGNKLTDPTSYYLSKLSVRPLPEDPFEVAILATHLLRKTESDQALVKSIQSKDKSVVAFQKRVALEIEDDASFLTEYVQQLKRLISVDSTNLPVQTLISTVYVLEKTGKSDKTFYERHLFPELKRKLKHASYANLADLTDALTYGKNFSDKGLWNALLDSLAAKTSETQAQVVEYSGWDLDKYEPAGKTTAAQCLTENQKYYKNLQSGGNIVAELMKETRKTFNYLNCVWFYRFFYNERRVGSQFNLNMERVSVEKLIQDLSDAARQVPDLSTGTQKVLGNLKQSLNE